MAEKRKKGGSAARPRITGQRRSHAKLDFQREAEYIVARAQAGDARVVVIGPLVFFSTESGDAWALDTEDRFAMPLCRGGEAQPYRVTHRSHQFLVEWPGHYEMGDEEFTFARNDGSRVVTTIGYPVAAIRDAIARCGKG